MDRIAKLSSTPPEIDGDQPRIDWQLSSGGFYECEIERHVQHVEGEIWINVSEEGKNQKLGEISMYWFKVGNMAEETSEPSYICSSMTIELSHVWPAIFQAEDEYELHPEIEKRYEDHVWENSSDILFLQSIIIEEQFRGRGLGKWAVANAVELFGSNCRFVVLIPFPLEYDGYQRFAFSNDRRKQAVAADPEFDTKLETAFARVEEFYYRLGFRQLPAIKGEESDFWAYCPALADHQPRVKRKAFRLNRHSCKQCGAMQAFHDDELCPNCESKKWLNSTRPAFERMWAADGVLDDQR